MYDSGKILAGLTVFISLFTSPMWYNPLNGKAALHKPELVLPSQDNQKQCVRSRAFMRSNHMTLLNDWRYRVVRVGTRTFETENKKTVDMNVTKTCLDCHKNASQFCDECHNYVGVYPHCWDCHLKPQIPENQ